MGKKEESAAPELIRYAVGIGGHAAMKVFALAMVRSNIRNAVQISSLKRGALITPFPTLSPAIFSLQCMCTNSCKTKLEYLVSREQRGVGVLGRISGQGGGGLS